MRPAHSPIGPDAPFGDARRSTIQDMDLCVLAYELGDTSEDDDTGGDASRPPAPGAGGPHVPNAPESVTAAWLTLWQRAHNPRLPAEVACLRWLQAPRRWDTDAGATRN